MIGYLVFEFRENKNEENNLDFVDSVQANDPEGAVEQVQDGEFRFDIDRFFVVPVSYVHEFSLDGDGDLFEESVSVFQMD